jgi:hypothetical protein
MKKFLWIIFLILCINSSAVLAGNVTSKGVSNLSFNRDNSVVGIKDGKLYAYVDLANNARQLRQLKTDMLTTLILDASVKSASDWWKAPRFAKINTGTIDVITILNKDEYAKADFSSALQHGKVYLKNGKNGVVVDHHTLNFENLLNAKLGE